MTTTNSAPPYELNGMITGQGIKMQGFECNSQLHYIYILFSSSL